MDKTYYTIYKITNKIDGKIYIGSHKTKNLNDNYMGSGKYLKRAQEKHGIENFTKEILHIFNTPEEMYAKESEIVDEDFLVETNTYNLKVGGFGGFDYINHNKLNTSWKDPELRAERISEYSKNNISSNLKLGEYSLAFQEAAKCSFTGKKHSDETKDKISTKIKQLLINPENNSQFGTMWITNGSLNKKIKKNDTIPDGWRLGRVMKVSCN